MCHLLPVEQWSTAWQQIGGTFWLSRLSRDPEAEVRAAALQLLGALLSPEAISTQRLLVKVSVPWTAHA